MISQLYSSPKLLYVILLAGLVYVGICHWQRQTKMNQNAIWGLIAVSGIIFLLSTYLFYHQNPDTLPIRSDGSGYYAYLPATFIYRDFTFSFSQDPGLQSGLVELNGNIINKYTMGTAILQLPFFLLAHILATPLGFKADGYSGIYQFFIIVAAFFYCLTGIYFVFKTLSHFVCEKIALLTCALCLFATNLFHYATFDACFSHVYSFFLISVFVYIVIQYERTERRGWLLGLITGFIFLTRVPNCVVLFFYLFYGVKQMNDFPLRMKKIFSAKRLLPMLCVGGGVISLHFLYVYSQTGLLSLNTYVNESFNWLHPEIWRVLFSLNKGILIWTPIWFALPISIIWVKREAFKGTKLAINITMLTCLYVISSWWCWNYGGSYSLRPFVDLLPFGAITIALVLDKMMERQPLYKDAALDNYVYQRKMDRLIKLITLMIVSNILFMNAYWWGVLPYSGAVSTPI